MYKYSIALARKFITIHELRPMAMLGMVLSSLTENVFFNIAAAAFLAIVHLPVLLVKDQNRIATVGSASLVTGGLAKISIFTIPLTKINFLGAATCITLSSLAPTLGNFLFSLLKIRDIIHHKSRNKLFARDIALAIGLISATILMSLPLWPSSPWLIAMCTKVFIIFSTVVATALMLTIRYEKKQGVS